MHKNQRDWLAMMALDELDVGAIDRCAIQAAVDLWDRLPKTADGVAVTGDTTLWFVASNGVAPITTRITADFGHEVVGHPRIIERAHSTEEAALASKGADPAPSA